MPLVPYLVPLLGLCMSTLALGSTDGEASLLGSGSVAADKHAEPVAQLSTLAAMFLENPAPGPESKCMPWLVPVSERCAYIRDFSHLCGGGKGAVPYLDFYYCSIGQWPLAGNVVLLLWVCCLLLIMLVVAERFFCPALEVAADFFKMPPSVAGATLLSFGNGAPDFFTQLAAIATMDSSSLPIAIGEPIGGGLFVGNVALAAVVWYGAHGRAEGVRVEAAAFWRDAGFYAGAVVLVAVICIDGKVGVLEASAMLAYYALFVLYIACFDRAGVRSGADALHLQDSLHYQAVVHHAHSHTASPAASAAAPPGPVSGGGSNGGGGGGGGGAVVAVVNIATPESGRDAAHGAMQPGAPSALRPRDADNGQHRGPRGVVDGHLSQRSLFTEAAADASVSAPLLPPSSAAGNGADGGAADGATRSCSLCEDEEPRSWFHAVQLPVIWLLRLTMPEVGMDDEVSYPRPCAAALPICCPLFVVLAKGLALRAASPLGPDALLYGLTCGAFASLVIVSIYPKDGRHYGALSAFFAALTFGMSILWMNVAASEMVRACKALGYIHGLSQAMLGVTVFAWANSFGDLVADSSMARDGFPAMGVAACFASPLFTMVGGLGFCFLLQAVVHGTTEFVIDVPMDIAFGFALASVTRFLILVPCVYKWQLKLRDAVWMVVFYVVFQTAYLWAIARMT